MPDSFDAVLDATAERVAIFSDFDGTLVEIASSPDAVVVPDDLPARLKAIYEALDGAFAVITGRTVADIDDFLPNQPFSITGSHGAQMRHKGTLEPADPALVAAAHDVASRLRSSLGGQEGILIEPKPTGVAVHYRAAPGKHDLVRTTIADALEEHDHFHVIEGKMVVEARPRSVDKGSALNAMMRRDPFTGRQPIFIGDDVTDEDGFAAAQASGGFGIKVGPGETRARFHLPDIASVYRYFDAVTARELDRTDKDLSSSTPEESPNP